MVVDLLAALLGLLWSLGFGFWCLDVAAFALAVLFLGVFFLALSLLFQCCSWGLFFLVGPSCFSVVLLCCWGCVWGETLRWRFFSLSDCMVEWCWLLYLPSVAVYWFYGDGLGGSLVWVSFSSCVHPVVVLF